MFRAIHSGCRRFCASFVLAFAFAESANAGFILDDFDDSADIVSPGMQDTWIPTSNVGDLDAQRRLRIFGVSGLGGPTGRLDSNVTTPSRLTGVIDSLGLGPPGLPPIVAVQSNYDFAPTDITEGGENNALFLDFGRMESEMPPTFLRVSLIGFPPFGFYEVNILPAPMSDQPFTLTLPFDSFIDSTGTHITPLPDLFVLRKIWFSVLVSRLAGGGPEPINFRMELDRIRVGRLSVPEPSAGPLFVASVAFAALVGPSSRRRFSIARA